MKKLFILSILLMTVLTTACTRMAPKCDSSDVINTVKELSNDEMLRQLKVLGKKIDKNQLKLSIDTIRTAETDKDTGSHACKANLNIMYNNEKQTVPITYTVENAEKGQFYVEVYGLR